MFLRLSVGLGDDSTIVGADVFVNVVGDIVVFGANVSFEVTTTVGELDREDDSVELQDVILIVGKSVML